MAVAAMHRIGTGREGLALAAPVRGAARRLAVDHVGRDRQHALSMGRPAIGRVLADLLHEASDDLRGDGVDPIVIIAELRYRAVLLAAIIDGEPVLVPDHMHLAVFYRGQAVG